MKTHSDTPVQVEMRNALHLQPESHCLLRGEWVISCWRGWHARRKRLCLALRALVVRPLAWVPPTVLFFEQHGNPSPEQFGPYTYIYMYLYYTYICIYGMFGSPAFLSKAEDAGLALVCGIQN